MPDPRLIEAARRLAAKSGLHSLAEVNDVDPEFIETAKVVAGPLIEQIDTLRNQVGLLGAGIVMTPAQQQEDDERVVTEVAYRMQADWDPAYASIVRTAAALAREPLLMVSLQEAEGYIADRNAWWRRISDALDLTWFELHGGGAVLYAELDQCVRRIEELKAERERGWQAAYDRGRAEAAQPDGGL